MGAPFSSSVAAWSLVLPPPRESGPQPGRRRFFGRADGVRRGARRRPNPGARHALRRRARPGDFSRAAARLRGPPSAKSACGPRASNRVPRADHATGNRCVADGGPPPKNSRSVVSPGAPLRKVGPRPAPLPASTKFPTTIIREHYLERSGSEILGRNFEVARSWRSAPTVVRVHEADPEYAGLFFEEKGVGRQASRDASRGRPRHSFVAGKGEV